MTEQRPGGLDDFSKFQELKPGTLPENEGTVYTGNLDELVPLGTVSETVSDTVFPSTELKDFIPDMEDYIDLIFNPDSKTKYPKFGKARVVRDPDGRINRISMLPEADKSMQEYLKLIMEEKSSSPEDKKKVVRHLLHHVPMITFDYKNGLVKIRRSARDTEIVLKPGKEHTPDSTEPFDPGQIVNAGELRSAELKVVDSKKNGIAYGIYHVRPDGMRAKMITPSHGDPYILVNTRGRIDNTTSSQIIHLDCRMKFDDIGYLMSYATQHLRSNNPVSLIDTSMIFAKDNLKLSFHQGDIYTLDDDDSEAPLV